MFKEKKKKSLPRWIRFEESGKSETERVNDCSRCGVVGLRVMGERREQLNTLFISNITFVNILIKRVGFKYSDLLLNF